MKPMYDRSTKKIAFVGNYLPRQCGIATFTSDLCETMAAEFPHMEFLAIAMNDRPEGYNYPERVRFTVDQEDPSSYRSAAEFLNLQDVDLVCVQHEFGIYGGKAGGHILTLLRGLNAPIVTTLHTVLTDPTDDQRAVMEELARRSDRLVVMSQRALDFLQDIYGVPGEKIDLIPHGIPDVPFTGGEEVKRKLGLEGKRLLLTFGLLSPNKGLEYVLQALPAILDQHPDITYLALGATHPHIKKQQGEAYRDSLKEMARNLRIEKSVMFEDRFVSQEELIEYIHAADIYITPYLNPAQIVSGTLAYTIGAGKAVISTPYWYAEELLAEGRGLLVPFRDSQAIASAILGLLGRTGTLDTLRAKAYAFGRHMIWREVAQRYMSSFEYARTRSVEAPPMNWAVSYQARASTLTWTHELPPVNLRHLLHMTDSTGILQHAIYDLPNYAEGYCTDDNARALTLAVMLGKLSDDYYIDTRALASRYLAFLWYAFNQEKGRFRNFLSFDGSWLDEVGSDDSHCRALWALGSVLGEAATEGLRAVAARLFTQALPITTHIASPRSWAFALLGIYPYLQRFPGDRTVVAVGNELGDRLWRLYNSTRRPGWYWFEEVATYNNATLPHALLLAGSLSRRPGMVTSALESLQWLLNEQSSPDGHFVPIGSEGFFASNGNKARFDQQPIEAHATVSACLDAYRLTGENHWYEHARTTFEWFLGRNDLGIPVYDAETGGCHDGLQIDRLNENQGAESTLAYLLSLVDMYLVHDLTPVGENSVHKYSLLFNKKPSSG